MQVYDRAIKLVSLIEDLSLNINGEVIQVIPALKALPRSGHALRIDKFGLDLPKQSVYDHALTLAYNCDIYQKSLGISFDVQILANYCVFHDLAEVIVGDVPRFTSKSLAKKHYLSAVQKRAAEIKANQIISENIDASLKAEFVESIHLLESEEEENTGIRKLFWMLDKTEPILSMWRYIYNFHDQIKIEEFLEAMTDFFDNPEIVSFSFSEGSVEFIRYLQNKENARKYYYGGNEEFENAPQTLFKSEDIQKIVERRFHIVE